MNSERSSRVGSTPSRASAAIVATMTEDEKLWCLDGDAPFWAGLTYLAEAGYHKSPFHAARVDRVGLPGFSFSDGPRGVVIDQATCFPVTMARGASWDTDLEERIGEAIGQELRAVGADLFGGVCVNVLRHPAWGRAQETYGEDPLHIGEMGAALTRGVQRHAMACVKHFACNSMENARFSVDIAVDEVALHEVYLPHFKRIVDEGVAAVMSAYNSVNGEWCGDNRGLLTEVLRGEWGFEGFVISDWILGIRSAGRSVHAGLDVEMPYRMIRSEHLTDALLAGEASWADVDLAVARVADTRIRFNGVLSEPAPGRSVLACAGHRALAREAAAKSVVLLRNEPVDGVPVLPLDLRPGSSMALLGRLATRVNLGDGGSSDVWAPQVATVADGLRSGLADIALHLDDGTDLARAVEVARSADVTLIVVGYTREDEGEYIGEFATAHLSHLFPGEDDPALVERFTAQIADQREAQPPDHAAPSAAGGGFATGGDRASLRLHDEDVALIRAVTAVNPRTVVAIVAGSAVVISEWDSGVPAIALSWYSGMEGGHGLTEVLSGTVPVAGRLPFSIPRQETDLPPFRADAEEFTYDLWHGYWHLARQGIRPAYPFGFGLSYTTFAIEEAGAETSARDIRVRATIRNSGTHDGSDLIQVYAHRRGSDRPERLVGFGRIQLDAGAAGTVNLTIAASSLALRDTNTHSMVVLPGVYLFRVAHHATDPGVLLEVDIGEDQADASQSGGGPSVDASGPNSST
jgi:beta-glucosidase